MRSLTDYPTIAFDCDGVVLNSNRVKTEAFRQAALPWGRGEAERLVEHHVKHGGVSRYKKFGWFVEEVLGERATPDTVDELLAAFASHVREGLLAAEVAEGLPRLRELTPDSRWLIVSGGDQQELREIFALKDIAQLFDGGIFGSPDDKRTIFAREQVGPRALCLGDSRLDWEVAHEQGADFIFVSAWTEVANWPAFVEQHQLNTVPRLADLSEPGFAAL